MSYHTIDSWQMAMADRVSTAAALLSKGYHALETTLHSIFDFFDGLETWQRPSTQQATNVSLSSKANPYDNPTTHPSPLHLATASPISAVLHAAPAALRQSGRSTTRI